MQLECKLMVGRRQLRENALKALYANSKNPQEFSVVHRNLLESLEKIFPLYVSQLSLLLAVRDEALEKIEIAKHKNLKTEADLDPNFKFVNNVILKKLDENAEIQKYLSKNQQLNWNQNRQYAQTILKKILNSSIYENYMSKLEQNFEEDKTLIHKIFDKYIAKNENLIDFYEEKDIAWADDIHIANSMTYKTLKFIEENSDFQTLLSIFKGTRDKDFLEKLLEEVMGNQEVLDQEIEERLVNWELHRIADIDKLILQMAIAELKYMPDIPPRVVLNEYIELAKTFSTPSSNVFINGILDKFIKDKNVINKES